LLNGPDRIPPRANLTVETGTLPGGRRCAWARTAPDLPARAILLCLHGRGEDERFPFDTLRVHDFAQEQGLPLLVAAVDGGSHSYWHPRRSGDPLGEVATWLPQLQRQEGGAPVVVMGWSMGGYGALLAAIEHPGLFAGVIASSAALWQSYRDSARGAFDDEADFAAHDVLGRIERLEGVALRIDCGEDDPFEKVNRRLLAQLPTAQGGLQPGFHDPRFWRASLPEQLRFVERIGATR
jgi:pimeloyl-ACP methyl ester carboxylesterase